MESAAARMRSLRLLVISATALAIALLAIFFAPQTVRGITSANFLPHAYCYLYDKSLIALHLASDTAIWLSYVSISVTLAYLVYRTRQEIPFSWMLLAFGTFIIACGFTHFMEMVVLWKPLYWLSADIKLVTAVASVITAIALPPLIPRIHQMVVAAKTANHHKAQLEDANQELFQANTALQEQVEKRTHAEQELRSLSGRLLRLQDEERRRLARELHDSTGQLLAAIQLNLTVASQEAASTNGNLKRWLNETDQLAKQAIGEVRTMSYLLHPPMLDEAGLVHALKWYVEGFAQRSQVDVKLDLPIALDRLPTEVELTIFRIVQEALANIRRHSGSRAAEIALTANSTEVKLLIRDYGKGISSHAVDSNNAFGKKAGVGIQGMRERVMQLGGTLMIRTADPGTIVEASIPLTEAISSNLERVSAGSI
jgi:signal transduction histidine kinase